MAKQNQQQARNFEERLGDTLAYLKSLNPPGQAQERRVTKPYEIMPFLPNTRRSVRDTLKGIGPIVVEETVKLQDPEILDGKGLNSLAEDVREYTTQSGDTVYAATDKGIGYKDVNEDRVGVFPEENQIVLADGMGGYGQGAEAAQCVVEAFQDSPDNPNVAAETASILMRTSGIREGGACYASARISEKEGQKYLDISQAGDVKAIVIRNGKLIFESKDQSRVQFLVDVGQISEDEALYHPNRNAVENAIMKDEHSPKISKPIPMEKGDIVILMTDGISDNLTSKEIIKYIRDAKPHQIIQVLSALAEKRMKNAEKTAAISGAYADPSTAEYKRYRDLKRERVARGSYSDGFKSEPKNDNMGAAVIQIS